MYFSILSGGQLLQLVNIGTQGVQELFFWGSLEDSSIHGAVYSNDLVNLTSFFGCNVQQERN